MKVAGVSEWAKIISLWDGSDERRGGRYGAASELILVGGSW